MNIIPASEVSVFCESIGGTSFRESPYPSEKYRFVWEDCWVVAIPCLNNKVCQLVCTREENKESFNKLFSQYLLFRESSNE